MNSNQNKESDISEIDDVKETERKKNKCLILCLVILIVMMLPSTLAFLAIF